MKKIQYIILTLGIVAGFGLASLPVTVGATSVFDSACENESDSALCAHKNDNAQDYIKTIVNTLLYLLGAISVIVIIIAGIGYTTSSGDAVKVTKAKNTLMYAVVGLVVAILAYAIVDFVVKRLVQV